MIKKLSIKLSAIAAMADDRLIGKNNRLPWHLPADFKHFKSLTTGHIVIMGRRTYESIGKPLPNRTNIVITRNTSFEAPGCIIMNSIDDAIQFAAQGTETEIFILGGEAIYKACIPYLDRIYLTLVHHHFEGDAYFPILDASVWVETKREDHSADEHNPYAYSFTMLER
ncbi:MAG: dihydrofolate reductase, partial [Gammaproteobacteria bacterium RIFCSPHIGHO2_12_FULL_38_14]